MHRSIQHMPTCLETPYNPCIHACLRHHASIYIIYAWLPVCHLQTPPVLRWPPWMAYEEPCIFTCLLSMVFACRWKIYTRTWSNFEG
ncbi:hypothetical protein OIU79_005779 [Salix purpurea]|uniref:Uncharacterized protein n=1 Tax=Salix purpurea TaxID=77065 RepID=A0A9Q0Z194_SALPP|nr:hypothetical protein OIU79_005779 [Salix purpurea]